MKPKKTRKKPPKKTPTSSVVAAREKLSSPDAKTVADAWLAIGAEAYIRVVEPESIDDAHDRTVSGRHFVWTPGTVDELARALVLSKNVPTFVQSGSLSTVQDRVDATNALVIDLSALDGIDVAVRSDAVTVKAGPGATSESVARALAGTRAALPLPASAARTLVASLVDDAPSTLLARSLGSLASAVRVIDALDADGISKRFDGPEAVSKFRASRAVLTNVELAAPSAASLKLHRVSFPYPGRDAFEAIATRVAARAPVDGTDLVLDAFNGAYEVPLVRLTAITTSNAVSPQRLVEAALAGTNLGDSSRTEAATGAKVLALAVDPLFQPSHDVDVNSSKLGDAVASDASAAETGAFLGRLVALVDRSLATDGEGTRRAPERRIFARLQRDPKGALLLGGFVHEPRDPLAIPRASLAGDVRPRLPLRTATPLLGTFVSKIIPGFAGEVISPSSTNKYEQATDQYASSSLDPAATRPHLVAYPKHAEDVRAALKYAGTKNKKVVARSGGHHYSGKSSGGADTIVLDMREFRDITFEGTRVRVGPGVRLKRLAATFEKADVTIPHGECPLVAIGGHAQTGGYGHLLRSYGLAQDHLVSLDLILADGKPITLKRPAPGQDPATDEEKLFWAVLGGNAGSYGVVTQYEFEPIRHASARAYKATRRYTKDRYRKLMSEVQRWTRGVADETLPDKMDFMMTVGSPHGWLLPIPMMLVEFVDAGDDTPARRAEVAPYLDPITADPDDGLRWWECRPKVERKPLAEVSQQFVRHGLEVTPKGREFDLPYKKRINSTSDALTDDFVKGLVELVDEAVEHVPGVNLIFQMLIGGGEYASSPRRKGTAMPWRDYAYCFVFDLFYEEGHAADAVALQARVQTLVDTHFSAHGEQRAFWGTFGDAVDVTDAAFRRMHYESEADYQRLQQIKKQWDAGDRFHTSLTVKLP